MVNVMSRVLVNGCGRIGRCVIRNLWERGIAECVAINEPGMEIDNIVYLLKFDTIYGRFDGNVENVGNDLIRISNNEKAWNLRVYRSKTLMSDDEYIKDCPDIIVEASGREDCARASWKCIDSGVQHVIITNTFFDADFTYVMGHNDEEFDMNKHKVISTSICDANATIPLISALSKINNIDYCFVTTLHPWLSYQNLMDAPVRMQRREGETSDYYPLGRASAESLIPKTTTLGPVLLRMFPNLKKRLSYFSYRTPTQIVASADMSFILEKEMSKEKIIDIFSACGENIVNINKDDIVSIDCRKMTHSSIVDTRWLQVDGNKLKVITWYDNEWGYSSRVIDLINKL